MFHFDNTYLSLPDSFYSREKPEPSPNPQLVLLNHLLFNELNIALDAPDEILQCLSGNRIPNGSFPFSQAYAGHQFGYFTMLGDGRAIHLGEHLTKNKQRYDIQLKGAGPTVYSRKGDGRSTLYAMLREYLISEAMHHLGIPSSRSLAIVTTGNEVYRERVHKGAMLTRVMRSHIRVGTFQFAARFCTMEELRSLTDYAIHRLYPLVKLEKSPVESFFLEVLHQQIRLVCHWMRVGFIHGVMNTDNTSISAETFDYGPCAFMNSYNPKTVYSSIDSYGRYSYNNQPDILKWNLAKLLECFIPLLDKDEKKAIERAKELLNRFDTVWQEYYSSCMHDKLGLVEKTSATNDLVRELLQLMEDQRMDYTNTFAQLTYGDLFPGTFLDHPKSLKWIKKWADFQPDKQLMQKNNPVFIPRNHITENILSAAEHGDLSSFLAYVELLKSPYLFRSGHQAFTTPPGEKFEKSYKTYCGT